MSAPFITAADLTNKIGRDVTSDQGAIDACAEACDIVRVLTDQDFTDATDTILLDGSGTDVLILPQIPVTGAGTILVNGDPEDAYSFTQNGLLYRGSAGGSGSGYGGWFGAAVTGGCRPVWPVGRQNIQVTYDHGYTDVPDSIKAVARNIAARSILQGPAISETVGAASVRYAISASDLTANELRILQRFRSPRSA